MGLSPGGRRVPDPSCDIDRLSPARERQRCCVNSVCLAQRLYIPFLASPTLQPPWRFTGAWSPPPTGSHGISLPRLAMGARS